MTRTVPALGAFLFTIAVILAVLMGGGRDRVMPLHTSCSDPPLVKVTTCGASASNLEVAP